jgi:hypothetical protein
MIRMAISPRLAMRIFLNIKVLSWSKGCFETRGAFPRRGRLFRRFFRL